MSEDEILARVGAANLPRIGGMNDNILRHLWCDGTVVQAMIEWVDWNGITVIVALGVALALV